MSNLTQELLQDCAVEMGCGALQRVLVPKEKDLGGFNVRRLLPVVEARSVGPWVFFDHMGPAHFSAGEGIDVRPHPHIGLATVTYLFTGEMLHRDSLGTEQIITPGAVNLMVAGKGIVHSERQRDEVKAAEQTLDGLQLWLALPTEQEDIDPAFYHYGSLEIPDVTVNEVPVRVLMGNAYGVTSPVKTFAETVYVEARLQAGQQLTLPDAAERAVYVVAGAINIGDKKIDQQQMALLDATNGISITAQADCIIAVIGGDSVGKRYMEWNFVSSDAAKIEQAKRDWQAGNFPKVPGDEIDYIPLPN